MNPAVAAPRPWTRLRATRRRWTRRRARHRRSHDRLAMMDGLGSYAFREEHWARFDAVGTLVDRQPLEPTSTTTGPNRSWPRPTSCSGHWGCPTLTAEVLARAPRLPLFAYAAGTVKWQVVDAVWERGTCS